MNNYNLNNIPVDEFEKRHARAAAMSNALKRTSEEFSKKYILGNGIHRSHKIYPGRDGSLVIKMQYIDANTQNIETWWHCSGKSIVEVGKNDLGRLLLLDDVSDT